VTPRAPWIVEDCGPLVMPDAQYHADPVVGGSLSSTGARTLVRSTPAHFAHERQHGRPGKREFDFGRAAHTRVLGVGDETVVIAGTGKDPNCWRTADDKAAVKAAQDAGKTPITPADNEAIEAMAVALRRHPTAGALLSRPGLRESVWVWQDPDTGVWCRLMADFLPDVPDGARRLVVDYKTGADASPTGFAKSMATYGYDQQGDWYKAGIGQLDPRDEPPLFILIAQEKRPPHLVSVNYLSTDALTRGRLLNRRALATYRDCDAANHWPGYATDPVELELPYWAARELDDLTIGDPA
jgi:hypothetical protein